MEIVGSTLEVLATQCQVKINEISTILVTRNAGYMAANLVGAILQKYVGKYPEALLSVSFLVSAIGLLIFFYKNLNNNQKKTMI